MRPIQAATLPVSLAGHNLVATAETGSGKTMCFAVVALAAISKNKKTPQVLIMAHNRALLDQLSDEMDKLCTNLKGEVTSAYADSANRGGGNFQAHTQIIVGTAPALNRLVREGRINTQGIKLIIADEVDDIMAQCSPIPADEIFKNMIQAVQRARKRPQVRKSSNGWCKD